MLHTLWRQSPVTVVRFLSESIIIIGFANEIQLFNWKKNLLLFSRKFRDYVVVHHIGIAKDLSGHNFLIATAGNRFYAAHRLHYSITPNWDFDILFECYTSDNVNGCVVKHRKLFDCFCFISAHGEIIVKCIGKDEKGELMVTGETSSLNASVCFSGLVKCFADLDHVNTLGFWGATFGRVVIRADYFRSTAGGRLIHDNHSELQTLHCQKGVIFSLDLCVLAQSNQCNLVSVAEDRSIAVWTAVLKTVGDDDDDVTKFRGPWELLYRLDGGAPGGDVIFQSRIRMTVASGLGMLAVGEDCRIVWYPWSAINEMKVINGTHRGHGIWCADLQISQTSGIDDAILVSGGNDGAVCVQSLRLAGQSELEVLNSQELPDSTKSESLMQADLHTSRCALLPFPGSDEDFPRSIFFGPEGRLFYLTNLGRMYMAAVSVDHSKPTCSHVQPYFRESVVLTVLYNRCYNRSVNPLLLTSASTYPSLSGVFSGYSVCSTNVDHTLLAIGDQAGRVYLFQFLNGSPYLVCTDFICLDQKLMKLIWLDADLLMVATRGGSGILLRVQHDTAPALFTPQFVTLTLPAGPGMRWINTGCLCPVSNEGEELTTHPVTLLIVGTRDGGLYMFRVNWLEASNLSVSPVWSLESCHGRGGCTAVLCFPLDSSSTTSLVISCGRTHGELRCWTANSIQGTLLLRSLIPNSSHLTWVERFHATRDGRLFALGFQSIYFKAYQISSEGTSLNTDCLYQPRCWFRAKCSGGNRAWDWWTSSPPTSVAEIHQFVALAKTNQLAGNYELCRPNSSSNSLSMAVLASINKGGVLVQWAWRPVQFECAPRYIRPNLHGRDVNCCILIARPTTSSKNATSEVENSSHIFFCFGGSEDTTLSSWALGPADEKSRDSWEFKCLPEHHRGHLSSIRCLSLPYKLNGNYVNWQTQPKYLITGGGRGQIGLWGVNIGDTASDVSLGRGTWRPGWLGFIRLRHSEPNDRNCVVEQTSHVNTETRLSDSESVDLRVMALVCLESNLSAHEASSLLVLAGCSDGSIRMVHIEPPQSGNPRNARMHEIGSVESMSGHIDLPRACYLDLQLIDYNERTILVGASTTRGELRGWCVPRPLPDGTDLLSCELRWLLHAQPIPPFNVITKPAMNCLSFLSHCNSDSSKRLHLAVGVDDGSVRVASIPSLRVPSGSENSEPRWIASAVHHFAAVVRIRAQSDSLLFFTLSADQRVVCWSFDVGTSRLTPLRRVMLSGLGDPHGMDIAFASSDHSQNDSSNNRPMYILTTGIGTILLRWSCK